MNLQVSDERRVQTTAKKRAKYKPYSLEFAKVSGSGLALRRRGHSKFLPQLMQRIQIIIVALLRRVLISGKSARNATAMESEFAGNLVITPARTPAGKSIGHHRVPGHSHASANCRKLFVFECVKKPPLVIRVKKLPHDAAFATQREKDHHQRDDERRPHDQKISREEPCRATVSCRGIPGAVQENREHESQHGRHHLYKSVVRLARPTKANARHAGE